MVVCVTAVSRMISRARDSEKSKASSKGGSDEGSSMVTETRIRAVRKSAGEGKGNNG